MDRDCFSGRVFVGGGERKITNWEGRNSVCGGRTK
jgi:hypothetical protein